LNTETSELIPGVILLDLNMPVNDGLDFLEAFKTFKETLRCIIKIYVVSYSIDEKDLFRSKQYASVKDFISMPLLPDIIRTINNAY
jgi:CheY-like chemotaxis protein